MGMMARLAKQAMQASLGRGLKTRPKSVNLKLGFESEVKLSGYWRMAEIEFWWEKSVPNAPIPQVERNEIVP